MTYINYSNVCYQILHFVSTTCMKIAVKCIIFMYDIVIDNNNDSLDEVAFQLINLNMHC